MAQLMIGRMNVKGVGLRSGFLNAIGGTSGFQAARGNKPYDFIMGSAMADIFSVNSDFSSAVTASMHALSGTSIDITNHAYFWNATSQKDSKVNIGFNWRQVENGTFVVTATHGATTFFKYADGRTWP